MRISLHVEPGMGMYTCASVYLRVPLVHVLGEGPHEDNDGLADPVSLLRVGGTLQALLEVGHQLAG